MNCCHDSCWLRPQCEKAGKMLCHKTQVKLVSNKRYQTGWLLIAGKRKRRGR